MKPPLLVLLFLAAAPLAAQVTDPMGEFLPLRQKYLEEGLPPGDLFRLANLYLIGGVYSQSAELYAELIQYIEGFPPEIPSEQRALYLARSHYNRGLALFTLGIFESCRANFERALFYDPANIEALRMLGSTSYAQKNKEDADKYWSAYLSQAEESPVKESVAKALALIRRPDFTFDPQAQPPADTLWPFRSYEAIPYPDALYEKKRVI